MARMAWLGIVACGGAISWLALVRGTAVGGSSRGLVPAAAPVVAMAPRLAPGPTIDPDALEPATPADLTGAERGVDATPAIEIGIGVAADDRVIDHEPHASPAPRRRIRPHFEIDEKVPLSVQPSGRDKVRWLVEELRDDDIEGNARDAYEELAGLGADAAPWLRLALLSEDRQQRQLAASLLRSIPGPPSELLLRACVEALEDDAHLMLRAGESPTAVAAALADPRDGRYEWRNEVPGSHRGNATNALEWFLDDERRIEMAAPLLAAQVDSPDPQASFLSAFLLARIGGGEWREGIVPILAASLASNEVTGDAAMASRALIRIGPDALPGLRRSLGRLDLQAETLLRHLIAEIAGDDDPDAVRLSVEMLQEMGVAAYLRSNPTRPEVPDFPAAWRAVPYRASLNEIPIGAK